MSPTSLEQRQQTHAALSAHLGRLDDAQIGALLAASEESRGWGRNQVVEVEGAAIFVKRLPVTALERSGYTTRNLYQLPLYYNYGVGSAGLGVFRELDACIKSTAWVLNGEIETFPLLYHYRMLPFSGRRSAADPERLAAYVASWGGDRNIERYMRDRATAPVELVLFLEHFPFTLQPWLDDHPEQIQPALDDLRATVGFLRSKGVIHFDVHFWNVVTDGRRHYLTDWGLVLDAGFELTEQERAFYDAHGLYDYAELLACLDGLLYRRYHTLPDAQKQRVLTRLGLPADSKDETIVAAIGANIKQIAAEELLPLDPHYIDCVVRYHRVMAVMSGFLLTLQRNPRKDTPYPAAELQRLLAETGVAASR